MKAAQYRLRIQVDVGSGNKRFFVDEYFYTTADFHPSDGELARIANMMTDMQAVAGGDSEYSNATLERVKTVNLKKMPDHKFFARMFRPVFMIGEYKKLQDVDKPVDMIQLIAALDVVNASLSIHQSSVEKSTMIKHLKKQISTEQGLLARYYSPDRFQKLESERRRLVAYLARTKNADKVKTRQREINRLTARIDALKDKRDYHQFRKDSAMRIAEAMTNEAIKKSAVRSKSKLSVSLYDSKRSKMPEQMSSSEKRKLERAALQAKKPKL